ncbi:MAG: hypothetical protein JJD98_02740 [Polaromonas sp.]|nr:hypothetical protein [Polaromonas sp.]
MLDEVPGIEERYVTANNTSNLKVEAERGGAADLLIAAGWSASRLGAALMRLHTKYDRAGLEQVHIQTALQASKWGIERPDAVAAGVVGWWLNRVCTACRGRKFELIAGTPALSTKHCKHCRGFGEAHLPHGESGRRLANWLDDCKQRAASSIKFRLFNTR